MSDTSSVISSDRKLPLSLDTLDTIDTLDKLTLDTPDTLDKLTLDKLDTLQSLLKSKLTLCNDPNLSYLDNISELNRIAGVDLSFTNNNIACACIVVLSYPQLNVVYEKYQLIELTFPYIPGYLAFREVPPLKKLIDDLIIEKPQFKPQLIFVDGNGTLHPKGFGLASHLGVEVGIPTIGVAKTIFYIDGIDQDYIKRRTSECIKKKGDSFELIGNSGNVLGIAYQSSQNGGDISCFISVGTRVGLNTALAIVKTLDKYKTIEPIRQADLRSREYLRNLKLK